MRNQILSERLIDGAAFRPLLYVIGPYAAKDEVERLRNVREAEEASVRLILAGYDVYVHHRNMGGLEWIEKEGFIPSVTTWMAMGVNILRRCDGAYVLRSWERSYGSMVEIHISDLHGFPLFFEGTNEPPKFGTDEFCGIWKSGEDFR